MVRVGIRARAKQLGHTIRGVPLLYSLTVVLLYVWSSVWYLLPCLWTGLVSLVVVVVIARGILEVARMRRRAWLDYYLHREGTLYRVLRGGVLMQTLSVALATGLAFIVLAQAPMWTTWHWAVLALSALVLFPIQRHLETKLSAEVRSENLEKIARHVCLRAHVGLVLAGLVVVGILSSQTDYANAPLEAVLMQIGPAGACDLATVATRLFDLKQEAIYWLLQNQIGGYRDNGWLAILGWGLSFLILAGPFSWAFTRLLLGLDYRGRGGQ